MDKAGKINSIQKVEALNQLRGIFTMHGENDDVHVFFSLTPEQVPKIQALSFWTD